MAWHRRRSTYQARISPYDDSSLPDIKIDPDLVVEDVRILIDEQLGHGGYGVVYVGDWRGTPVAVKRVHSALVDDQVPTEHRNGFLENFAREWRLFGNLRHPFIVQFLGVYQPKSLTPALVMELMEETLQKRYKRPPYLSDDVTVRLCGEVLCALVYLHGRGVVHRDLTTNNVLLTRGSDPTAKISDLGVARALFGDDPRRRAQLTQSRGMTRGPGAILYMSPESVDDSGRPYDTKHDMFSFGVLALSASVRHEPCCLEQPRQVPLGDGSGSTRTVREVERRAVDLRDLPPSHPLRGIILRCLRDSPSERPTASELVAELERLPEAASIVSTASVDDNNAQKLRDEVAKVQQELKASTDRERAALEQVQQLQNQLTTRQAAQEAERRSHESAKSECRELQVQICQLQQQLKATEVQLTIADEQAHVADQRARTASKECEQSRRVLEEVLSQQDQSIVTTIPSATSPRLDTGAVATPTSARLLTYCQKSLPDIPGGGKCRHHAVQVGEWIVLVDGINKSGRPCRHAYAYNIGSGRWSEWIKTPYPGCCAASDGEHLYVVGGEEKASALCNFYRLSDSKKRWIRMPDLLHPVCFGAATVHRGKLFVHGGNCSNHGRLQVFDFSHQSWFVLSSAQCFLAHSQSKYALVAWGEDLVSSDLCAYNTVSDHWYSLPYREADATTSLAVIDGQLIAVGAFRFHSSDDDRHAVDVLESVHSKWSSLPRLPSPRQGASASALDDRLFVSGGMENEKSFLQLHFS